MSASIEPESLPDNDFTGQDGPAAVKSAGPRRRIAWENYLRCFFLMAIFFLIGLLAWRPGLLRFSLIWSLANPSRGESLAWTPEDEDVSYYPEIRRVLPPDEWRLTSTHSTHWQGSRPRARQDGNAGGKLDASQWRRFSSNPWRWRTDSQQARVHQRSDDILPAQKPATEFRAGELATWPAETSAPGQLAAGGFPTLGGISPLPDLPSGASNLSLPALGTTTEPPSLGGIPDLPALPSIATAQSGGDASSQAMGSGAGSFLPPPTNGTAQARPTQAVAQPEQKEEVIDWKNREITGPIPGAYLTVYPKLKFIGLCVPGQGYIRKYNQVGIPKELTGAKMGAQDGRTPYGKYYIADRQRDRDGARLYLSWPSPEDAQRIGIDPGKIAEINNAWRTLGLPPQDTAAGGGVGITGLRNWVEFTEGGFTMEEPQMEEIFTALPQGAWVFIQP